MINNNNYDVLENDVTIADKIKQLKVYRFLYKNIFSNFKRNHMTGRLIETEKAGKYLYIRVLMFQPFKIKITK